MNYPQHIIDRPSATIDNYAIHEVDLIGRNKDCDAILALLDAGSDPIFRRKNVDLIKLAPWLPQICLHDFVLGDSGDLIDAIVRFQGPEIGASYSEITGQSIFNFPEQDIVQRTFAALKMMIDLRRPIMSSATGTVKDGDDIAFQALYLPLSSNGEDVVGSLIFASIEPLNT